MAKTIDKVIEEKFKYLIDEFNFKLAEIKEIDGGYEALFLNEFCGVQIKYEFREAYIFIMLYRLQNGKLVANPRNIKSDSTITGISLDDIISLRKPNAILKPAYEYGQDSEFYDKEKGLSLYVSLFAKNLRENASDVLYGDFSVFDSVEPIVKQRAQRN